MSQIQKVLDKLGEVPGIKGVHIIASGDDDFIPEVLTRAGLPRRGYGELDTIPPRAGQPSRPAAAASIQGGPPSAD